MDHGAINAPVVTTGGGLLERLRDDEAVEAGAVVAVHVQLLTKLLSARRQHNHETSAEADDQIVLAEPTQLEGHSHQ